MCNQKAAKRLEAWPYDPCTWWSGLEDYSKSEVNNS